MTKLVAEHTSPHDRRRLRSSVVIAILAEKFYQRFIPSPMLAENDELTTNYKALRSVYLGVAVNTGKAIA
jgi:hypothetical protein